jgi:hypothetical protein
LLGKLHPVFNDYDLISTGKNVIISNQPYFYKKAELFPGSAFIIGADTAARLVNVRNYLHFLSSLWFLSALCTYF